ASAPETSHQPIIYPVAVVKGSKNEQTARMFVSFVLSEAGGKILEKNGFKPVQK
ncbi:MAG TPA: extracellular solute-binding protein, partial [Thermodesulfobacteriota bacterium]|nr:extracellular solute-binding protein [Thermodesulfobacteriota bacterium]